MTRNPREQRKFERVPFHEPVVVGVDGEDENLLGETRDISLGGLFIEGISVPFGRRVTVYVTPPGALDSVRLPGLVRWVSSDGVGIQFGLLGARETHLITEIVAAMART